jgi:DNA mismatch endonuclease (patch repair protein)
VDGCFWHGCPVHYTAPRTREQFWKSKLEKNVRRDIAADEALI